MQLGGGDRNRLYIDQARVTEIIIRAGALRLTFHDGIYLGLAGATSTGAMVLDFARERERLRSA